MGRKRKLEESIDNSEKPEKIKRTEEYRATGASKDQSDTIKSRRNDNTNTLLEPENEDPKETEDETNPTNRKPGRKRKKLFYNSIRHLMEFYFSDANLRRDRFFGRLIKEDPYIPLDVFLKCNKIKELTTKPEDIVKALSKSTALELNEAKDAVKRCIDFQSFDENVDQKTLYVESLPTYADQDWIKAVFERFGKVNYVSLPRYSKSRKLKGFGFVEFENEEGIQKAMETFAKFNSVLLKMEEKPTELSSFKNYYEPGQSENGNDNAADVNDSTKSTQMQVENAGSISDLETKPPRKRKRHEESDPGEVDDSPKRKHPKLSEVANGDKEQRAGDEQTSDNQENDTKEVPLSAEHEGEENGNDEVTKKKRSRKKRKIPKSIQLERSENQLAADVIYYELKILPKVHWKRLRNMYLNLQRQKVAKLKQKHRKKLADGAAKGQPPQQELEASNDGATGAPTLGDDRNEATSKLQKLNYNKLNFYGAAQDGGISTGNCSNSNAISCAYKLEPGLIVQVAFLEPCVDTKDFKAEMRQNGCVKYVDVKEGDMKAHVRLETAEAAQEFVQRNQCAEYQCCILTGEAELQYWSKISNDRHAKLNKTVKIQKRRGRQKVKAIIRNHVRFDEDTDHGNEGNTNDQIW